MTLLAIDIGGTFTDLMAFDEKTKRFFQAKSPSTPDDLAQGIIDCIAKSGMPIGEVDDLIHGTTQAINTLIERKGAKTALLVTKGHARCLYHRARQPARILQFVFSPCPPPGRTPPYLRGG